MEWNATVKSRIESRLMDKEKSLAEYACKSTDAVRFREMQDDVRPNFSRDADKIIHSYCYSRYIDKTQAFYLVENDHITHRVLHVQLVSKIARTIGRFLNLNEDLIEAISLGHDVGHTPFGHDGERIVSNFLQDCGEGIFEHNVQSFRLFHDLEAYGKGLNLTAQVLDGIICHNGEVLENEYGCNRSKTPEKLLEEYKNSLSGTLKSKEMVPMTLEGCVMRISDVIAYVGRDVKDALILKLIKPEDVPKEITEILGDDNEKIVNTLITDLVNNSIDKDSLSFSSDVFNALDQLKKWNYDNIYTNPKKSSQDEKIRTMFRAVFETCLDELRTGVKKATGINHWYEKMSEKYKDTNSLPRVVADYVSGMTDDYLMNVYKEIVIPKSFGISFEGK
ncbi:deoxyguanosinetriphosphate triphosphohydrolase family protein [Fibrobacter succinogenes]|uniref:deoxyguanosinetriphosphate triphosphohydrolase family protein n=1 Tax=Fibrobacter succinogenes TaxID=833 RepID=UPI0015681829|nr:HD domain-containing protein [Fibrobacter succinogenes]